MRKNISSIFLAAALASNCAFAQFDDMPHHAQFLEKQKTECNNTPSKKWDAQRNSCVTTAEVKDRRDRIRSCADETKYPTSEARKKCHEQIAESDTGVSVGEGSGGGLGLLAVSSVTAVLSAIMFATKTPGSSCTSRNIFAGTSAAGLAAEFFYIRSAKKKLKELQEAYEKETASGTEYHAQKRAFEFLKEEQLAIKEFEEKRRNALYVMTAGYAASGVWAVVEGGNRMNAPCGSSEEAEAEKAPDQEVETQDKVAETNQVEAEPNADNVEEDVAEVEKTAEPQTAAEQEAAKVAGAAGIDLNTPMSIAASSLIAGTASMFLATAAARQVERSDKNAKMVQEIIDQFEADFGQFCPQGRDDLQDPNCYCYNLDGSENSKRSNSNVCLSLWAQKKNNLFAGAGSYQGATTKRQRQGCAFINGQFDEDCRCRDMKNPKGQNACLKVGVPGGMLGQLGQMSSFPTAMGNLNNMAQGALGTGEFNPQSLSQNALAITGGARRAIEEAFAKSTKGKTLPSSEAMLSAGLSRIPPKVLDNLAARTPGAAMMAAEGRPQNAALLAAMEKAQITPEQLNSVAYSPAKRPGKNKANKAQDKGFFDDWGNSSASAGSGDILNFMEKNYEYKGKDIVERDDVSLWQIISNRYTQSGLRRLFGEEGDL